MLCKTRLSSPLHRDSEQNNSLLFCVLSAPHFSLPFYTHSARKFVYLFIFVSFETEIHVARASLELTI